MSKESNSFLGTNKMLFVLFGIVAFSLFGLFVFMKYTVETNIDWNKSHIQLITNKRLTNSLTCGDIHHMILAPESNWFVDAKQVTNDLNHLLKEKGCN